MKVVAFSGSARKDGNTAILVRKVLAVLETEGIETELVQLAGHAVHGCKACYVCQKKQNRQCSTTDDVINECIAKMLTADGIILASPTYFTDVSTEMKALIDRSGTVCRTNGNLLRRKVGAGVVAVRRAGAMHAFDTLNHFFLINEMVIPGSSYWNIGRGRDKGEVEGDEEGIRTMTCLGQNMAWLLKHLHG